MRVSGYMTKMDLSYFVDRTGMPRAEFAQMANVHRNTLLGASDRVLRPATAWRITRAYAQLLQIDEDDALDTLFAPHYLG